MKARATFVAVLVLTAAVSMGQQAVESLQGKKMPAFSMKNVNNGKTYSNTSLKGKVVVLDFWATWCGPCKMASPTMQKLHQKYASKGLVVIGSNITDTPVAVKKYAAEHGYTYNFTQGNDALSNKLGIQGIPAFLFIDKKGVVRRVDTGFAPGVSPMAFEKTVSGLLAER